MLRLVGLLSLVYSGVGLSAALSIEEMQTILSEAGRQYADACANTPGNPIPRTKLPAQQFSRLPGKVTLVVEPTGDEIVYSKVYIRIEFQVEEPKRFAFKATFDASHLKESEAIAIVTDFEGFDQEPTTFTAGPNQPTRLEIRLSAGSIDSPDSRAQPLAAILERYKVEILSATADEIIYRLVANNDDPPRTRPWSGDPYGEDLSN